MASSLDINLRKVGFSDIEFLWYLRNQPDVYQYSRTSRPVQWEEHINWIIPILLGLTKKELFIIQSEHIPVGQIRLDWSKDGKRAEIGISIVKEFRGKGIASSAIRMIMEHVFQKKQDALLTAEVHKHNVTSIALFEKLGFVRQGEDDDSLCYERENKS